MRMSNRGNCAGERTSCPPWLQALLVASDFRREVVIISFASTVAELLAGLRFCVEIPFGEVAFAGTWLFRQFARIFISNKMQESIKISNKVAVCKI